jgi:hypothetical protein
LGLLQYLLEGVLDFWVNLGYLLVFVSLLFLCLWGLREVRDVSSLPVNDYLL